MFCPIAIWISTLLLRSTRSVSHSPHEGDSFVCPHAVHTAHAVGVVKLQKQACRCPQRNFTLDLTLKPKKMPLQRKQHALGQADPGPGILTAHGKLASLRVRSLPGQTLSPQNLQSHSWDDLKLCWVTWRFFCFKALSCGRCSAAGHSIGGRVPYPSAFGVRKVPSFRCSFSTKKHRRVGSSTLIQRKPCLKTSENRRFVA